MVCLCAESDVSVVFVVSAYTTGSNLPFLPAPFIKPSEQYALVETPAPSWERVEELRRPSAFVIAGRLRFGKRRIQSAWAARRV